MSQHNDVSALPALVSLVVLVIFVAVLLGTGAAIAWWVFTVVSEALGVGLLAGVVV